MPLPVNHPYKKLPPVVDYEEVLWTPREISTALWLDAADSSTLIQEGSGISQWKDKSGNARHATQTTDALRPTLSSIGALAALAFSSGKRFDLTTPVPITSTQFVIAVYTRPVSSSHSILLGVNADGGYAFHWYTNNLIYVELGLTTTIRTGSANTATGTFIHSVLRNGSALALNLFDNVVATTGTTSVGGTQYTQVGARNVSTSDFMSGNIGELIVCDTIDSLIHKKLTGYVANKWGLKVNLSTSNEYKIKPPVIEKPLNYFTAMNLEGDDSEYGINSLSIPR